MTLKAARALAADALAQVPGLAVVAHPATIEPAQATAYIGLATPTGDATHCEHACSLDVVVTGADPATAPAAAFDDHDDLVDAAIAALNAHPKISVTSVETGVAAGRWVARTLTIETWS